MAGKRFAALSTNIRSVAERPAGRAEADGSLYEAVGALLRHHRLAPTPANYAIFHAVVGGPDSVVGKAVASATAGDLRLTQAAADIIATDFAAPPATASGAAPAAALAATVAATRNCLARYADIVDTSRAEAEAYGAALTDEAAGLTPTGLSDTESVVTLLALTHSMIEKTRAAEAQLRAASTEMKELRASLATARQDADTDSLTRLPNRRAFETRFASVAADAAGRPIALAMCDIDRFKAINDRHGHDVGDRVIRLFARELEQGCPDAMVARYGGEEFVLLFDGLSAAAAIRQIDATRAAIHRRDFRVTGTDAVLSGLSFSAGLITVSARETARDAVRRADGTLYQAKNAGRNRVDMG